MYNDKQGNNILHQLAYRDEVDTIKLYVNHAGQFFLKRIQENRKVYSRNVEQEVQIWIDESNA